MLQDVDIQSALLQVRNRERKATDELLRETRRILKQDLFAEKKILENLRQYNRSFEVVDEEDVDREKIFTLPEIKKTAVTYRLRFVESRHFKPEIPYEAVLKIKALNEKGRKELRQFRVLSVPESFIAPKKACPAVLFAGTNYDNYYLIHAWGPRLGWARRAFSWPLRRFENLFITVLSFTFIITMLLPTWLITLDAKATYWSGYRAAAFFHLLIFNMGVTAYITFAFSKNFSSTVWDQRSEFD